MPPSPPSRSWSTSSRPDGPVQGATALASTDGVHRGTTVLTATPRPPFGGAGIVDRDVPDGVPSRHRLRPTGEGRSSASAPDPFSHTIDSVARRSRRVCVWARAPTRQARCLKGRVMSRLLALVSATGPAARPVADDSRGRRAESAGPTAAGSHRSGQARPTDHRFGGTRRTRSTPAWPRPAARSASSCASARRRRSTWPPAAPPRRPRRCAGSRPSTRSSSPTPSASTRRCACSARPSARRTSCSLRIDASKIAKLATDPNVVSISPVVDYEMALDETVPYIGAKAVQSDRRRRARASASASSTAASTTPTSRSAAPGPTAPTRRPTARPLTTRATSTLDGLFPTAKVVGRLRLRRRELAGRRRDRGSRSGSDRLRGPRHARRRHHRRRRRASRPSVKLYALKVCSAVDTALLRRRRSSGAMDWAVDPNGDGATSDHLDIVNMSLGSDYGESFDDDLSLAVDNASTPRHAHRRGRRQRRRQAVHRGHAGQRPDRPVGRPDPGARARSPSRSWSTARRPSPASTRTPRPSTGRRSATGSPATSPTSDGAARPARSRSGSPEDPYLADPDGKVALIDRGDCSVSLKVDRAAEAGATAVLIGLVAPGDAVSFSIRRRRHFVPTMVITQSLSSAIKAQLADPGRRQRQRVGRRQHPARWRAWSARPHAARHRPTTRSSRRSARLARPSRPSPAPAPAPRRSAARPARPRWSPARPRS